jgi:hypothetical protein
MTWLPWLGAMVLALLVFAANGWYQHRTWWRKGGSETHFMELDAATSMPSITGHEHLGQSFEVRALERCLCAHISLFTKTMYIMCCSFTASQ